ncbi:hypothetical protein QA600_22630 [Natronococcus sp. A-GB1]|uniref:hypothetical protein n=1 Tax=Natronococcus sp. A-GB1 TaxID=3037648 RepID=UPI0024202E0B|nr:hypothetical protein [Natronococcus sp. A-GB1]MDG5762113.1 hypothetical protein [Natronococcus sp. A-GB1]
MLSSTGVAFFTAVAGCADLDDEPATDDDGDGEDDDLEEDGDEQEDDVSQDESDDSEQDDDGEPYEGDQESGEEEDAENDEDEDSEEENEDTDDSEDEDEGGKDESIDGEFDLREDAKEQLIVRDHWFEWNADGAGCKVKVELEKNTREKYLVSFETRARLYSEDGDNLDGMIGDGEDKSSLENGETRIYTVELGDCEDVSEYEAEVALFRTHVSKDEMEGDFDLDSELEGKLEVVDSAISTEVSDGYVPVYDSEYSNRGATVKNVTDDYRLSVRGPSGEHDEKTVDLEPGETADFVLTGWKYSAEMGDLTYGFSIESEGVTELDGKTEDGNETNSED